MMAIGDQQGSRDGEEKLFERGKYDRATQGYASRFVGCLHIRSLVLHVPVSHKA
jgi:hypothetical protein